MKTRTTITDSITIRRALAPLAALTFALGMTACDSNDGPLEEAGAEVDEAVEEVGDEIDDATDG